MLSRIWGRTHSRSTARDIPFLPYSPFGDLERISPLPEPGHSGWLLESTHIGDLNILIGFAIMNGLKIRLHGCSGGQPTLADTRRHDPGLRKTDGRKEEILRTENLRQKLHQWQQSTSQWQSSLETLQGISFGSMNSLEVLQIILQGLPKANLQLFRRVDISTFEWSEPEFRMIENHLAQLSGKESSLLEWHFDQMRLNSLILQGLEPDLCISNIHQVIADLDEVMGAVQNLGKVLTYDYRCREDAPDWSTVQGAVGRSTLLTLPEEEHIQTEGQHLQTLIDNFSTSLIAHGWFRDWFGFQFISFEEMELEIHQLFSRLIHLKDNLPEIIEVSNNKHTTSKLPPQIQALLQVLPRHRQTEFVASFPCWYLNRWLENRTPPAAWKTLSASTSLHHHREELQQAALELLNLQLHHCSWQERIFIVPEGLPQPGFGEDESSWIDLYWNALPPEHAPDIKMRSD